MQTALAITNALAIVVLVAVTWWYARSTSRLLRSSQVQAAASEKQAAATQASLELLQLSSLPEWDLRVDQDERSIMLEFQNNGLGPARSVRLSLDPDPPGHEQASLSVRVRPRQGVVSPGSSIHAKLTSENPPYEGEIVLLCQGRWGLQYSKRWRIRLSRQNQHPFSCLVSIIDSRSSWSAAPQLG